MKKILICEDDVNIIEIMTVILEGENYEVKSLSNGRGIIKTIKEFSPDVIFLDIWLPGISGKEIAGLIKKEPEISNIPIIVISALNEHEVKAIVSQINADDYLLKPFTINQILEITKKFS